MAAQPKGQWWPVVVLVAAATVHPAAMSDNLGATKTTRKTNVGPWQQSDNKGGYDNGGANTLPSSPANGQDNNAAAGNNQGDATVMDIDGGDADAGMLSILLVASNTPNHDNNANDDYTDAKDVSRKKTLMRDATAEGNGSDTLALVVILPLHNEDIGGGPCNSALALSVAHHSCYDDKVPRHCRPSLVYARTTMAP